MSETFSFGKNQKSIYLVIAIVLLAVVLVVLYKNRDGKTDTNNGIVNIDSSTVSILASNQKAGAFVDVASLSVPDVSWVAVRENNNDVMGRILGAQKVNAGTHENVMVELLRSTAPNVMYAVVVYKDNGDGVFDFRTDELVMNSVGGPILSRFVTE